MNRRLTGLIAAGVLALVGTIVLVGYVRSAEARALEGEKLVEVLVVTDKIEAGTPVSEIADSVTAEEVPTKVRADGAIAALSDVKGLVATVDLLPGEQLIKSRFAKEDTQAGGPNGLLEVTVRLEAERALGGMLKPGDRVAVVSSFDPFEVDAAGQPAGASKKTPNMTHLILHKVLVTNVQIDTRSRSSSDGDDDTNTAPAGTLLVTLAVDAESMQRVVFTAEHGTLWLSAEPSEAPEGQLPIETLGTVNR